MASRLYKVLNSVENYRKNMIKSLREKNLNVSDDVSFGAINAMINELEPHLDYSDNIVYYENPEDDPAVWKVPEVWPNIEEILKSKRSHFITVGDVEYELYPYEIVLFTTTDNTVTFRLKDWQSVPYKQDDNVFIVASQCTSTKKTYGCYLSLETSDGRFIDFDISNTSVQDIEHSFDDSKDVIASDGTHFKYIILYQSIRKLSTTTKMDSSSRNNALYYTFPRHGANIHSYAMVTSLIFTKSTSYFSSSGGTQGQQNNLEYVKFCTEGFYYKPTERDGSETYNMLYYQAVPTLGSTQGYIGPLYRIEMRLAFDGIMYFYDASLLYTSTTLRTNTLISNSKTPCYGSGGKTNYLSFPNTLVYCNCSAINVGNFSGAIDNTVRMIKYITGYNLKYTDDDITNNYNNYKHEINSGYWPFLRNFEPLTYRVTKLLKGNTFQYSCTPETNLNFSHLTTGYKYAFSGMNPCNVVDLSAYTGTLLSTVISGLRCNKVILTGMSSITDGIYISYSNSPSTNQLYPYGIPEIIELDLSNVLDINLPNDYFISATYANIPTKIINLSSLQTINKSNAFNCFPNLETLILKDQFNFTINLAKSHKLSIDCIKDLFTKAAVLEEGVTRYMYFNKVLQNSIQALPEYENVLAKGWMVSFN